jgi:radical SAM superfamily enzyme YgiQ (UPF0313 family)
MKILLISPSSNEFLNHSKGKSTICTALPLLAAYTPSEHQITIADQNYGDNVYLDDVDLVGISAMTPQAKAAYTIADHYRQKGVTVVMGGIHASMLPDEALQHADAICIGEGDAVWTDMLVDVKNKKLKKIYKSDTLFDMAKVPALRNDLVKRKRTTFGHTIVQATRGCPFSCEFCITSTLFGNKYRFRPIENVIDEIKKEGNKLTVFIDDNIFGNLEYSEKLFNALIPLKIKWAGQSSLNLATKDEALLKLAKRSGCIGLFVGLESISNLTEETHGISKKLGSTSLEEMSRKIKMILDNGIIVQSSMIFGLDNDDIYTFEKSVNFLKKNGISFSSFCILTPYPGTQLYERFKKEGRLLHEDWGQYSNQHVVFKPVGLTPKQLKDGSDWAGNALHTVGSIIKRFRSNWRMPIYYLAMNIYTRASNHRNHGPGHITKM